ncbi:hypothetical protein F5880DRAFT_1508260, partial [Lentinula raphanica]
MSLHNASTDRRSAHLRRAGAVTNAQGDGNGDNGDSGSNTGDGTGNSTGTGNGTGNGNGNGSSQASSSATTYPSAPAESNTVASTGADSQSASQSTTAAATSQSSSPDTSAVVAQDSTSSSSSSATLFNASKRDNFGSHIFYGTFNFVSDLSLFSYFFQPIFNFCLHLYQFSGAINTGAVVGGIAGGLAAVSIIRFLVALFLRRYNRRKRAARFEAAQFRRSAMVLDDDPGFMPRPPEMVQNRENNYISSITSTTGPGMAGAGAYRFQQEHQDVNQGHGTSFDTEHEYYRDQVAQQYYDDTPPVPAVPMQRAPLQPRQQYTFGQAPVGT